MSDKAKELIFDEDAREFLRQGIKELTDVVGVTLGPKGRYVGLDTGWGAPQITNDGNSIVKDIVLKNQYANMGASIGKEMATKMKETCGDGTTTSILLLGALVDNGIKNIASGTSPILVKRGMEKACEAIVAELTKRAKEVNNDSEIEEIATSSASGAREVGKLIAQAFKKVGKTGVISIEEAKGVETTIEMVEGMQFDRGYLSAYFSTNTEKMICELNNPRILITDAKIGSVQDILPVLQAVAATGQELLIIADDIEGDALSTLVINQLRGKLKVCAVKAPGFGDRRKACLEDLAILTGAVLVSEETGTALKDADSSMIGSAEKIVITKEHTTIISGAGNPELIQKRVKQIVAEAEKATNSYDRNKLEERKAKLSGGVAVIKVGATTEAELKQKKQLFEDSLNSTRSAIEEGIVVGGGIALLRASKAIEKELKLSKEEEVGARITFESCSIPFKKLVANSGFDSSLFLEEILGEKEHVGFNVATGQVENLFKAGIFDPLKMVKNGLKSAISAAGVILLSECLIGDAAEEKI
ncbi:MAG: chaperonin GroEL [Verrucomicrobia bacterium]|nr:chaperonin GroEL [Verrucomicrobiota bacterium]